MGPICQRYLKIHMTLSMRTRDVSAQHRIDVISILDKQSQTLSLSPVSCWVDWALAWEADSSLCGDGDERSQDSAKNMEEMREGWNDKRWEENRTLRKMFIRLRFAVQCFLVTELKNSDKQKALCRSENTVELWGAGRDMFHSSASSNWQQNERKGMLICPQSFLHFCDCIIF